MKRNEKYPKELKKRNQEYPKAYAVLGVTWEVSKRIQKYVKEIKSMKRNQKYPKGTKSI